MNDVPSPKDLRGAAAVAVSLAYATGLAGVVAGAIIFQRGEAALGVVVWVITFAMGAALMVASFLVKAIAAVMAHLARVESDVRLLVADRGGPAPRVGDHHDVTPGWD